MAVITKTTTGASLQLDLAEQLATPEPSLRVVRDGEGTDGIRDVAASGGRVPAPTELDYYIVPGSGGHGKARADGLLAVIQAFACRVGVYGYDRSRRDKFLIMVAARPVLDALEVLLPRVAHQMESAARAASKAYGEEVRSALPQMPHGMRRAVLKVPYFRDYLRGFGKGAGETIRGIRTEFIQAGGSELAGVLAGRDVLAEELYNQEFPDTRKLPRARVSHANGYEAGLDAGLTAELDDDYLVQHDLVFAML
jgi:hypothetical protein